ncbi:hypothetical protein MUN82_00170 [Hymenobacter aerilatus]|uniref:Uncharacterized protein n=1 Tax=Hymenobacter aerilatus TaxID=2932251 RepID=A0A8T9SVW2_9BACT|nr:hypothetical protein [Hymenobacter aerilatus]UOR05531.1 hypothetical protein MUN82_00170 [Hymenobacter aerilatus]
MLRTICALLVGCALLLGGCADKSTRGDFVDVSRQYDIKQVGRLPKSKVTENSGLAPANKVGDLWTHSDGGNSSRLYQITRQGDLLKTIDLAPLTNIDWEDLTHDDEHRLYLGDFGNNQNKRRNLAIYRLSGPAFQRIDTIRFAYPDQRAFPPKKSRRNFDCEAFFYSQDSLYLFTKNRSPEDLWVKQYVLPARPGTYVARLADSLLLDTWITAADLSPDGRTVALLGRGRVYLFRREPGKRLFDGAKHMLRLPTDSQVEGLSFINPHDFIISSEKGRLYQVTQR